MIVFDRYAAGEILAKKLKKYRHQDVVIFAIPRGGVALGYKIAETLQKPLELLILGKVGHPEEPELNLAAVAEDGHITVNPEYIHYTRVPWFTYWKNEALAEIERKKRVYGKEKELKNITGKIAIIVDDGIATGLTMKLAIEEIRHLNPKKIVVATPFAPIGAIDEICRLVDDVVLYFLEKDYFHALGDYYEYFPEIPDKEVVYLLKKLNPSYSDDYQVYAHHY